jgi:NADH-quinone oxidoreductase subunit A
MKLFVEKCTNSSPSRSGALKRNIGMASDYLPLLILILLAAGFGAIAIGLPALLGPRERNSQKLEPYESGIIPFDDTRRRFPVKYYLVAMLFLIFDIEVIFLYPWAAVLRDLRVFALVAMVPFFIVLVVGFLYEWKKGALDWD